MKNLTQDDFKFVPDWADCLAIDADGDLHAFNCYKEFLTLLCDGHQGVIGSYWERVATDYDATNWQNSAIDREAAK